jgi:transcriptional regulator GlxA family with amidase domain
VTAHSTSRKSRRITRRVVLVGAPGTQILDLVGPFQIFTRAAELFAAKNPSLPPIYSVEVVSTSRGRALLTNCGLGLVAHHTFRQVKGAVDTLLIAGGNTIESGDISDEVLQWIRDISAGTRRVGSVCTGALLLAQAGLLNGKKATTHWKYCKLLATKYPATDVNPDPIFIRDGNVYTSAGVTAVMDLSLALIEEDHGSRLALEVARDFVLYLRRPGGQSQFSAALSLQATDRQPFRDLVSWVLDNLGKDLNVSVLAQHVAMSPRNFARVFAKEMNTTPALFVERLRVEVARQRLEESQQSLKRIATECGFRSVSVMRGVFQRLLGTPPGQYRQRFRAERQA